MKSSEKGLILKRVVPLRSSEESEEEAEENEGSNRLEDGVAGDSKKREISRLKREKVVQREGEWSWSLILGSASISAEQRSHLTLFLTKGRKVSLNCYPFTLRTYNPIQQVR